MKPTKQTILNILGKQPYTEMLVIDRQDTQDIIEAIMNKHERCASDYDKFAYLFDGGTVPEICKRLFDFCKENLRYVVERTKAQYTSKPATMLTRGHADCKGYALFCGGVLDALKRSGEKINWAFRFASYKLWQKRPYHVFIVVFYQGGEIYIDPVFNSFTYRKPAMWMQDYIMTVEPAKIAGMLCDQQGRLNVMSDGDCTAYVGATTAQTGQMIQKISPALAAVPVVGWIGAGVGAVLGGALALFGDKFTQGPDIRWLIQGFEFYVKGIASATSDNHIQSESDNEKQQTWGWFSAVTGVPVFSQSAFNSLSTGHEGGKFTGLNAAGRAATYIRITGNPGNASQAQIEEAATIAAQMDALAGITATKTGRVGSSQSKPGAWKNLTAAPSLIDYQKAQAGDTTPAVPGNTSMASLFQNKWLLFAIIGAGIVVLYEANKKPTHGSKRA